MTLCGPRPSVASGSVDRGNNRRFWEQTMRYLRCGTALLLATILSTSVTRAQIVSGSTGAIIGTVTDATTGVLPGVSVTASGPALMGTLNALTDENGAYRLPGLPVGAYELRFELQGFGTILRQGITLAVGFTATVNVEMTVGSVEESITVSGNSPVVDLQSTAVATSFDAEARESLPGARDVWALMAVTPGVNMSRMDVGGSGAWTQQGFQAYGVGGGERNEVEGILVNEGAGQMYYTDYSSFAEVAVTTVGGGADVATPGVYSNFVSKSGGNTYRGNFYYDYQNEWMEAYNIDDAQIASGLAGSPTLDVRDLNRLEYFRDFTADLGGYVKKDRVWWYGAFRDNRTGQRFPTLIDDVQETWGPVYTGKVTANVTQSHKLIGYYQRAGKEQPDYLGAILIGGGRNSAALMGQDTVWYSTYPNNIWKAEYNGVLSPTLYLQVRGGAMQSVWGREGKSALPRVEDIGNNVVSGGVFGIDNERFRPQANGSLTWVSSGPTGTHNLKVGGEMMYETLVVPFRGFEHPSNAVASLNNGVPNQVRIYLSPSESKSGLWNYSTYLSDSWRVNHRLTLSLGLRFDRNRPFLQEQIGPSGELYSAVDSVVTWNDWGPRLGASYDLTGDGRTVVKANYGKFWLFPAADFASSANPNSQQWYRTYAWNDPNRNGVYDAGEQGTLQSVSGGTLATTLDPDVRNTFQHQASLFLEREVASSFGVRTGVVWKGPRQPRGTAVVNRPYEAFSVPVTVLDPGPDGVFNNTDDGGTFTAYNLDPAALAQSPVNITRNFDDVVNDYYTWEISATKRGVSRWSTSASFAHTWSSTDALGTGTQTPTSLINADGRQLKATSWQAKAHTTFELPKDVRLISVIRHQAGTPFERTFTARLNYGNATIRAEENNSRRTPNMTIFDVRSEKTFRMNNVGLTGFFDVYNIFNTNAEQALTTTSGSSWLRPSAITPPRIARVGVKLAW